MKKKILALTLCLALLVGSVFSVVAYADTTAGTGYTYDEATDTYTVTTADGLVAVANAINAGNSDANVLLAADIDLAGKTWTPIGTSALAYNGTFDGKNFTIKNLTKIVDYQTVGVAGYAGLIGKAAEGCTVKDLKFDGANIMGVEFTGLVIGETAQANAEDTTSKVTIENVHIRNSDIKGSNGWGTAPTSVNKNEYTGALIGKAVATHTVINNCTVVANITSECRTAGILGGESVGSGHTMTISNCVVGGAISQNKVATGSGSVKDGGATAFVGYNDKFVFTLSNCVSVATLSATNGSAGALTFNSKKTTMTAINCVVTGNVIGKALDTSVGSNTLTNVAVYDTAATADKVSIVGNLNGQDSAAIKVDGVDTTWGAATVPALNTREAFKIKISTIFANNEIITQEVLDDVIGHDHSFTNEVVDAKFLKAAATCTEAATYYKSCSCGIASSDATFTDGEPLPHNPSDKWTNDDNTHWHVCTTCLEAKSDEAEHTYGEWVVTKEATENRTGKKVKTCTVCGFEVEETVEKVTPATDPANTDDNATETGCASSVLGIGAVLVATLGMGAALLKKKD